MCAIYPTVQQVVRVQHHPGLKEAASSQVVEPSLKMEYIGCINTGGREESGEGDCNARLANSVPRTTVGGTDSDAPAAMTE